VTIHGGLMNPNATPYSPIQVDRWHEGRRRDGLPAGSDGRLAELRQLDDYIIADGDPDIRGWQVRTCASPATGPSAPWRT
jgi:hypothetical protein